MILKSHIWGVLPGKKELESLTGRKVLELPFPAIVGIWASIGTCSSPKLSDEERQAASALLRTDVSCGVPHLPLRWAVERGAHGVHGLDSQYMAALDAELMVRCR